MRRMDTGNVLARLETAAEKAARSLLKRRDVKVVVAGTGACYDWKAKTLYVPAYSVREDTLPIHVNAWRGLLDHECAHVAHTDFAVWDARIAKWQSHPQFDAARVKVLGNVFEDFMIERVWCETRPGSVAHLEATARIVVQETGGASACDPDYCPPGSTRPMGVFGAFAQAILRVGCGEVDISDVHPDVRALLDLCESEITAGVAAADSAAALDAAEAVWLKIRDADDVGSDADGSDNGDNQEEGDGSDADGAGNGAGGDSPEGADDGDNPADGSGEEPGDGDAAGDGAGKDNGAESGAESGDGGAKGAKGAKGADNGADAGADSPDSDDDAGGGVGRGSANLADLTAKCIGGEYGEIEANDVIAGLFTQQAETRPYTVHPTARASDKWVRFGPEARLEGRKKAKILRSSCSAASSVLANRLRTALKAQKRSLWVGALEEGADIDPDGLPGLASGHYDPRIFADRFTQQHDNTFVTVLVDCSGSMGKSDVVVICPTHGKVNQKGEKCSRKGRCGARCNEPLRREVRSKAGYAAMTAMTLHDALRACGTQHAVLGYTTRWNDSAPGSWRHGTAGKSEQREVRGVDANGNPCHWPKWSRYETSIVTYEFVSAPGLHDDGSALSYITGSGANCDGDSLLTAAEYMVRKAASCTRMVLLVVADGLPSGSDDSGLDSPYLKSVVQRISGAGIEVYGIGVGLSYRGDRFADFYPNQGAVGTRAATGHVLLDNAKGLDIAVMQKLANLLVKSNGRTRRGRR